MIRFLQTPSTAKKVVLGGLLLVICIAMVITLIPGTGVTDFFGAGPTQVGLYATVGDQQVMTTDIQRRAQSLARQQNLPQQFVSLIMPQAASQLVMQKAMIAEAHRLGLMATDEELRDELRNGLFAAELYPNGQWVGQQKYDDFTRQAGLSIPEFERLMKEELLIRKLNSLVEASTSVNDEELQKEFVRQNVRVRFDYAVITADAVMKSIKPSEAELRKYYEASAPRLKDSVPEERKIKYVVIDAARLLPQAKPTPEELQRFYNDRREQFRVEDEVKMSQIVVNKPEAGPDGKVDPKAGEAARAKAQALLQQVRSGADFAAVARKDSEDTETAQQGGAVGWVKPDQIPTVREAVLKLNKGQISDVIDAGYAFVILKVDDKRAAHVQTLDEVRAQIEPVVAEEKAQRLAEQTANKVLSESKNGLESAAAKNGLNVITSDFFNQRAAALPGVGASQEFMQAVFAAKEKAPPALVRAEQGYAVFQVEAVKPPRTPSFEEVRAQLEEQYRQERAGALLAQRTQELSDRARSLHDLKRAARELGARLLTSEAVGPGSQVPEIGQASNVEVVFDMKPGQISGPLQAGRNGVVLALLDRQEPAAGEMAGQRDMLREALLRQKRAQAVGVFAQGLRERLEKEGKIKYNQAEKEKLEKGNLNLGS